MLTFKDGVKFGAGLYVGKLFASFVTYVVGGVMLEISDNKTKEETKSEKN